MPYTHNVYYRLMSAAAPDLCVNLYGSFTGTAVPKGTELRLWRSGNDADQLFVGRPYESGIRLHIKRNESYAMNHWTGRIGYGKAAVWPVVGASRKDSELDLITIDAAANKYRVKLVGRALYLTATETAQGKLLFWKPYAGTANQAWVLVPAGEKPAPFPNQGKVNYATYPMATMRITQNHLGTTSHRPNATGTPADYPFDEAGKDAGRCWLHCPCDEMVVLRKSGVGSGGTNTIWLKSTTKVRMPIGEDYLVMMVIHPDDDDLAGIAVGRRFKRGEKMFREGKDGANAYHHHISCGTGNGYAGNGWVQNTVNGKKGKWVLTPKGKSIKANDAFYIDPAFTKVVDSKGYVFKKKP